MTVVHLIPVDLYRISNLDARFPGAQFRELAQFLYQPRSWRDDGRDLAQKCCFSLCHSNPEELCAAALGRVLRPLMVLFSNLRRSTAFDVFQLRAVFIPSANLSQLFRSFRASRIASILGAEDPASLPDLPKVFLHVILFNSMSQVRLMMSADSTRRQVFSLCQGHNVPSRLDSISMAIRTFTSPSKLHTRIRLCLCFSRRLRSCLHYRSAAQKLP